MNVTLYSTHCPRCTVLERKLNDAGVEFTENNSVDEMLKLGIKEVPVLMVDETPMSFHEAVQWVNDIKGGSK